MTAPANNDYITALDISSEENGSLVQAFAEATPSWPNSDRPDVWYTYTAQVPGRLRLTAKFTVSYGLWWIEMYRGETPAKAFYVDAKDSYQDDGEFEIWVDYDVSPGVKNHITVYGDPDAMPATFTFEWFLQIPAADPTTGQKNEILTLDYPSALYLTHNPLLNEVWVLLSTSDNLYRNKVRSEVIARTRDADGVLVDYVEYPTEGLNPPFFYDAKNSLVWGAGYGEAPRMHLFDAITALYVRTINLNSSPTYWDTVDQLTGEFYHWTGNVLRVYSITGTLLRTVTMQNAPGGLWMQRFDKDGNLWAFTAMAFPYPNMLAKYDKLTGAQLALYDIDNTGGHRFDEPGYSTTPDKRFLQRMVYDPDRNSLWLMREGMNAVEPRTQLLEFSLATNAVVATYPVQDFQRQLNLYQSMVYDPYRQGIGLLAYDSHMLAVYSTTDGSVVSRQVAGTTYDYLDAITPTPYAMYVGGAAGDFYRVGLAMPSFDIPIINDRDVWLQTFVNRFEKTTVQPITAVGGAQGSGTGLVIYSAKRLDLTASTHFFTDKNMIVEPPWITLTPTLRNLSGPPTYSVISGSATLEMFGDKARVEFGDMGSEKVVIRASVTDGGVTYMDQVTLVKLVYGGTAISHLLTNEMHYLMADSVGNVLSYMGASGEFRVWEGAFEITADCDFSVLANPENLLTSISNLGRYAVTGIPSTIDAATVTLRATYNGTNYDQVFTLGKIKAPAGGAGDPTKETVGGKRLPMHFTVPIPGTTWSTVAANQAVIPYNGTVLNDIVTEYNNSAIPPYEETRFWNFTEWTTLEAKIDGNLLVTGSVSADKLTANAIEAITGEFETLVADQITTNNLVVDGKLTALEADIDTLIATRIEASEAEIDLLIAQRIEAVDGKFDTLTVGGTQINPNSINTGHVVNNAITVPLIMEGSWGVISNGAPYTSGTVAGSYAGPATVVAIVTVQIGVGPDSQGVVEIGVMKDGNLNRANAYTTPAGQIGSHTMQVQIATGAGAASWGVRIGAQSGEFSLISFSATFHGVMK